MLKIQVLGTGMIPRLGVIAPRIEPFMADLTWISLILSTPGLEINYIDPTDYSVHPLDRKKFREIYKKFENVDYDHSRKIVDTVKQESAPQQTPVIPEEKFSQPEEKSDDFSVKPIMNEESENETTDETNDDFEMKPVTSENNNYQNNNGGKKKKHNR